MSYYGPSDSWATAELMVDQLREWADLLQAGDTPIESIIAGMREVALDLAEELG